MREAFLTGLAVAEASLPPIIERRVPVKRDSGATLSGLSRSVWAARDQWQYAAGIAAMLAVGVGVWWVSTGPRHGNGPEVAKLRHELLGKEVRHLAALTRAETPAEKVAVWSAAAADLHAEARHVYAAAPADEMVSLQKMYARAVDEGLVRQARLLPPGFTPAERQRALAEADRSLEAAEADAKALAATAPPKSQGPLKTIAETARAARAALQTIVREGSLTHMTRAAFTLLTLALVSLWADAQTAPPGGRRRPRPAAAGQPQPARRPHRPRRQTFGRPRQARPRRGVPPHARGAHGRAQPRDRGAGGRRRPRRRADRPPDRPRPGRPGADARRGSAARLPPARPTPAGSPASKKRPPPTCRPCGNNSFSTPASPARPSCKTARNDSASPPARSSRRSEPGAAPALPCSASS